MRKPLKRIFSFLLSAALAAGAVPCRALDRVRGAVSASAQAPAPVVLPSAPLDLPGGLASADLALPDILPVNRISAASASLPDNQARTMQPAASVAGRPASAAKAAPEKDSPAKRLAGLFQDPSLEKVRGRDPQGQREGLDGLYDRLPALVEDELGAIAPKLLGEALSPEEIRSTLSGVSFRKVPWYHNLYPTDAARAHGVTHADKTIDINIHHDWRQYPSVDNHFRVVFAHEFVHRLQLMGLWSTAMGREAGPVTVHILRAIELSGLEALRQGAFPFILPRVMEAFDRGRAWARSNAEKDQRSFYTEGFLAGVAFEEARLTGRFDDAWEFVRRTFSAHESPKAQGPPFRLAALPREGLPFLHLLGEAGYYVGNAAGFIYPLFQIRKAFLDGDARSIPFWSTLFGMTASLALALNATVLARPFWGIQNLFGALGMIAPFVIARWLANKKSSPAASWGKAALAALALLGLSAALYAGAAAILPALLGMFFEAHHAVTLAIQIAASSLFFLMFAPPIVSVLKGKVPHGFTRFFSLAFAVGGLGTGIWALDKALGAQGSAQLAQFVIYTVSQLTLAAVSFASFLLSGRRESGKR